MEDGETIVGSFDGKQHMAKPGRHGTNPSEAKTYEHKEITDNRLLWEVLAETDEEGE